MEQPATVQPISLYPDMVFPASETYPIEAGDYTEVADASLDLSNATGQERAGYMRTARKAGQLVVGNTAGEVPSTTPVPVGVLKFCGTGSINGYEDALAFSLEGSDVDRMVKHYAGKKNRELQEALYTAIDYIASQPKGDGSHILQRLKGSAPTYNYKRVKLWRFKPGDARGLPHKQALRNTRIVYATVTSHDGVNAVALLDIISRNDFGNKYN